MWILREVYPQFTSISPPLPLPFQNIQNIAFIFFKEISDFQNNEEILLEHPHKKVPIVSLFMSS